MKARSNPNCPARYLVSAALLLLAPSFAAASDPLPISLDRVLPARDSLEIGTEANDDARRCLEGLAWEPVPFDVSFETADPGEGDLVVRFPSAAPIGNVTNDLVAMEWYVARDENGAPKRAPALVVVHESGRAMEVGRLIAKGMSGLGVHALMVQLPGYGRRRADPPIDEAELFRSLRQAIADVRRARDAVAVLPSIDKERIALQGTSLGGFVCATVAGVDRGFRQHFILLAGGNLHDVIERGAKDAAGLRRKLEAAGIVGPKLRELTATVEPLRIAHRIDARATWLYTGRFDDVVPPENSRALAAAAKLPRGHHIVMLADHYSGILQLPIVLGEMRERLTGEPIEAGVERIDPEGIRGTLVLVGGGPLPDEVKERFARAAGGAAARLVIVPSASEDSDRVAESGDAEAWAPWLASWNGLGAAAVEILPIGPAPPSDAERALLSRATGLWFDGGDQSRLSERIVGTAWESEIRALSERGGAIGGTSAGAAIQSRVMIASGAEHPEIAVGLDLLPGAIVDQHFSERQRLERSRRAIASHPDRFGLGIDEGTAVIVRGRSLEVLGSGGATLLLAATANRPASERRLVAGEGADLTSLRRAAANRARDDFPFVDLEPPRVRSGTLVIVGGGALPREIVREFVAAAGGAEARIVILPTAEPPDPNSSRTRRTAESTLEANRPSGIERLFLDAGAATAITLPERTTEEFESESFREALRTATGIWFGGGRQWRFVDAYEGTIAEEWLRDVLARGGAIGGSSAGATIQGDYLARGNPLGNLDIMAEGYERGFGYLPGVAIDQHFTERGRLGDLESLVRTYTRLLGIGIDEGTALIVRGDVGRVLGNGAVTFVSDDRHAAEALDTSDASTDDSHADRPLSIRRIEAGSAWHLIERRELTADSESEE